MARVVDLTGENVTRQRRKERNYGTKTDLSSTTVERGNTHWAEGSNVNIDGFLGVAGTQRVTGLLDVTGTFNGSGVNNMDGTNNLSGDNNFSGVNDFTGPTTMSGTFEQNGESTFNGPTHFNGSVDITETLDVTAETRLRGATTVEADLEITAGGIFKAGVTKIEPNGKATFGDVVIDPNSIYMIQAPGGNMVSGAADQISLSSSTSSSVSLDSTRAELDYKGAAKTTLDGSKAQLSFGTTLVTARAGAIDLDAAKTWLTGQIEVAGFARFQGVGFYAPNLPSTSNPPNIHITSGGQVYRSTWTP